MRGPGELHFGGLSGVEPTALWEIYALGLPNTGLGRIAATFPGEDVVVATIVEEGDLCPLGDFGPGHLGLIIDATTPDATLHQVVAVDQLSEYSSMPYLEATLGYDVMLRETLRVQWYTYDPDTKGLSTAPTATWDLVDRYLDSYVQNLGRRPGRQAQAIALGSVVLSTWESELLVWGRTVEDVGPSESGSSPDGVCTFWSKPYVEPDPIPPATTTSTVDGIPGAPWPPPLLPGAWTPPAGTTPTGETGAPPAPVAPPEACGCAASGTPALTLAVLVPVVARRRERRRTATPSARHVGR